MGWPRQVTVTVAGVNHTSETLDSVFIQRGRTTFWDAVQASLARIVLLEPAVRPAVGQTITVDVALDVGGTARVFTGTIQAITAQFVPSIGTTLSIDSFGPLAKVGRRDQTDTLPQQLEGVRIRDLLTNALAEQWAEQPLTQQWGQVPVATTWADYAPDTSQIDDGLYLVEPLTSVPVSTFSGLGDAMFAGNGVIYETGDGTVGYADSTRRQGASLGAPTVLDGDEVLALSATTTEARDNIVNQASLEWSGGSVLYTAVDSVSEYGFVRRDYSTILDDGDQALDLAERLVSLQAFPGPDLQGPIVVPLAHVSDALTDELLTLDINAYLEVDNIPTQVLPAGTFLGFVEGINYELTDTFANVELFASDQRYSIYDTRWADVTDTATWGDVLGTLQWQNA
jgi:hypothetical protein